jgi:hypothetical protein
MGAALVLAVGRLVHQGSQWKHSSELPLEIAEAADAFFTFALRLA